MYIRNPYITKFKEIHYEIPNLIYFYNIRGDRKQSFFYLTDFLIKLSYKYCFKMLCILLLKRFLFMSFFKYTLNWNRYNLKTLDISSVKNLFEKKTLIRKNVVTLLQFKIKNLFSFIFNYSYFLNIYTYKLKKYLKTLSIKDVFKYFFIYNKCKLSIYKLINKNSKSIFISTIQMYFLNRKEYTFDVLLSIKSKEKTSLNSYNTILFLLLVIKNIKKQVFLKEHLLVFKKEKKHILSSFLKREPFSKNQYLFKNKTVHLLSDNTKFLSNNTSVTATKQVRFILSFLKKYHFLKNYLSFKSWNWFNYLSFNKLKLKMRLFFFINSFQSTVNKRLRLFFLKIKNKFFNFLNRWANTNPKIMPFHRRAKLFAHFKGFIRHLKHLYVSRLNNNTGKKKPSLNRYHTLFNTHLKFKFLSILGKRKLLKELTFLHTRKKILKMFLKIYYNINYNTFFYFIRNLKYKLNITKIKDFVFFLEYKSNIFLKKYFFLNLNEIEKLYQNNFFKKKHLSNCLLNIGDIIYLNRHRTNLNYKKFMLFLNFIFFVDPFRLKKKKHILNSLYNFVYNSLSFNKLKKHNVFKSTKALNLNTINNWYVNLFSKILLFNKKEAPYTFYKSVIWFYNQNYEINKINSISTSRTNHLYLKYLLPLFSRTNSYIRYNLISFCKKANFSNIYSPTGEVKTYILNNKYWKFKDWLIKNKKNVVKHLLVNNHKKSVFSNWRRYNNHFYRWSKYSYYVNRRNTLKNIFFSKKRSVSKNYIINNKLSPYIKDTTFLPLNYYKLNLLKHINFFNNKKSKLKSII